MGFYVDPDTFAAQQVRAAEVDDPAITFIAGQPTVAWLFPEMPDVAGYVQRYVTAASAAGRRPVFAVYGIPKRDCSGYSAGGCPDPRAYRAFIADVAHGVAWLPGVRPWVILEPDALMVTECLSTDEMGIRLALLRATVTKLKSAGASVYLDAGDGWWMPSWSQEGTSVAGEMAGRLALAGVAAANGYALNVSNFVDTTRLLKYAHTMSRLLGGKHFVLDTSRNGNGRDFSSLNINPPFRALGALPTTDTGDPLCDAYLWVKYPGSSDGEENGGPPAGQWWPEYARDLWARSVYASEPAGDGAAPV